MGTRIGGGHWEEEEKEEEEEDGGVVQYMPMCVVFCDSPVLYKLYIVID